MATGPTLQLQPITSAPHSSSFGTNVCGSEPSRQLPSSSIVTCATIGSDCAYIARRQHRLMNLFQISECLQNQQIDAAFDQRFNLLAKGRRAPPRNEVFPRGSILVPSGPTDPATHTSKLLAASRASRTPASIDVAHLVRQTVPSQAERVGTESIGFNNLGSSLQIFVVNPTNQVGLREIQFVVRSVDEDAFGVEQRPHGAVAQYRGLLDPGKKVSRHIGF